MIPEEIINKIGSRNVNFYITCRYMHYFIHVFYKKYSIDWKTNPLIACLYNKNRIINDVLVVSPKPLSIDLNDYYHRCVYKIINLDIVTTLPTHLTYLTFDDSFNQSIDLSMLHQLKTVIFGKQFNQPLNLPNSLKLLSLKTSRYDLPLILPPQLEILLLGPKFNQSIRYPDTLKQLILGNRFNKSIDNLPQNLKILRIGYLYNKFINYLPPSLTMLFLSDHFNQPLDHLVLPKLKLIKYCHQYDHTLFLPDSLETLMLMTKNPIPRLPPNLKNLYLPQSYPCQFNLDDLPLSLTWIHVGFDKINVNRYKS